MDNMSDMDEDEMMVESTLDMTGITVCLSGTMHQMADGSNMMNSHMGDSATFCKDCVVYPVKPDDCFTTGGVCLNATYHTMESGM
eukprot:4075075-Amphidinium_carterae.1